MARMMVCAVASAARVSDHHASEMSRKVLPAAYHSGASDRVDRFVQSAERFIGSERV
jgi:hypothetical protein